MNIDAHIEVWPLRRPFRISGLEIRECPLLVVEIEADGFVGRGEATGVIYRGETADTLRDVARSFAKAAPSDLDRDSLQHLLPSGGARNAIDCALWELDARRAGTSVWKLAGIAQPRPLVTTYTIGADTPAEMADWSLDYADATALKLKLTGEVAVDIERVIAVRAARPDVWLAVDANRGYAPESFARIQPVLEAADIRQVEQPFPIGAEADMDSIEGPFDLVADESVQDIDDLSSLVGRFDVVNIKLDKSGGLTQALAMATRARELGLKIMVGNMVGTAWSQAPGFVVGQLCDVVDLDGALFLSSDRRPGVTYRNGMIWCGDDVWGSSEAFRKDPMMPDAIFSPYLLFLGDAPESAAAKTAAGIAQWRPERVLGQFRLPTCQVDLGLRDYTPAQAAAAGARTMVVGIAAAGGVLPDLWLPALQEALTAGLDLAAGLHVRLGDHPELSRLAREHGRRLHDVRQPTRGFPVGNGQKRSGLRVLTVGTDCAVGKKYTALALERELHGRGVDVDFRATGQTGILIAGSGVVIDSVIADFVAGAAETLSPANQPDHWDVIEGQGSLFHPAYAGVTLGLIHGSQPDALVICHEPGRRRMVGFTYELPDLQICIDRNVQAAQLTNPACRAVGISANTGRMTDAEATAAMAEIEAMTGLPCEDPIRFGLRRIADALLASVGPATRGVTDART